MIVALIFQIKINSMNYPIIGGIYKLERKGKYIGVGKFENDPIHGECFIWRKNRKTPLVFMAVDEWTLIDSREIKESSSKPLIPFFDDGIKFCNGYECGMIAMKMELEVESFDQVVRSHNVKQIRAIAKYYQYSILETEQKNQRYWLKITAIKKPNKN